MHVYDFDVTVVELQFSFNLLENVSNTYLKNVLVMQSFIIDIYIINTSS